MEPLRKHSNFLAFFSLFPIFFLCSTVSHLLNTLFHWQDVPALEKKEGREEGKEGERRHGTSWQGHSPLRLHPSLCYQPNTNTRWTFSHFSTSVPFPSSFLCLWLLWPYPCHCRTILRPAFPCSHHRLAKLEIIFLLFCADKALHF